MHEAPEPFTSTTSVPSELTTIEVVPVMPSAVNAVFHVPTSGLWLHPIPRIASAAGAVRRSHRTIELSFFMVRRCYRVSTTAV